LHAVAQEPRDDHLDETKCDGTGQSDTSSDTYGSEGWGFEFLRAR